jgi:hypothetical protein
MRLAALNTIALLSCIATAACGDDSGERVPLGSSPAAAAGSTTLSAEARASLEQGNTSYRAKQYPEALAAYRRAAGQAPADAAPLWGIQMAARAMGDTALVDSTLQRMRAIAPDAAPTLGGDPHVPGAAAATVPGSTAPLPANHPPVNAQGGRVSGSPR